MRKTIRAIAVVLCVVMVAASLYGCTMKINVNYNDNAQPAANNSVVQPTAAPATQAPTAAPTTQAPTAAPANDTPTDAPANDSPTAAPANDTPADTNAAPSTKEEIVAEYAKVYNATKATGTFLGSENMTCDSVSIDGSENSMVKGLAGQFMKAEGTNMPLPPYSDDNPANECLITADDVQEATYTDNGDGTATIKIVPVATTNDKKFQGAQGKMFNVMEDVASALANISILSWSEGDANSNVTLNTKDGYAEVTYNKDTKLMTKAEYVLITYADVVHCNIKMTPFKDKSLSAKFVYTMSYPQ